ncbi:retrovirus-related pol polyprotein from transposon TNT 1-94 [Tanacetum coccineum]
MLTQQDIYAAGSENRPPMPNKDNYVPWSSRLLRYAKRLSILPYNQKEVDELRAERLAKIQDLLALMANSNNPFNYPVLHLDLPSSSTFIQQPLPNNNYNPQSSFNLNYMQQPMPNPEDITDPTIAQPGMNLGQDNQMQMVGGNKGISIANQNMNGNVLAARAEGNANGNNGNQIRCYNCRGLGHLARNCIVRPRRRDVAYLDEIEEVNANCILMANLEQASTSGTQSNKALIYDSDGLAENDSNVISAVSSVEQAIEVEKVNSVNRKLRETNADLTTELARYKNQEKCFEISQEKYDKLERCYQQSVYQEQCLTKKINALHLSSSKQITALNEEISNLNKQLSKEKSTVSSLQEEKKRLKSDFKIREDELLDKQIQLENKIKELDNILVKTGQSIQTMHMLSPKPDSFYHTEQKMALGYQNPFYLKQAQQKQQSLYNGKVLLEKHDPPTVYDSEETLELALESRLKMKQLNKEIKPANYTKINHLSGVFVSQTAKSREELYLSNTFKTANVSKSISIPNEEFLDDATPSVARKFLNEVSEQKDTSKGVDITTKTRRPQPRSNTKNDRVPSASKSSCIKNKEVEVEEHHRNLLLSKNKKHMSSECNNVKLAIRNDKSEVVCAMCKQCLITANHDVCVLNYVNGMNSRGMKQKANVSNTEKQKKQNPKVRKSKKLGSKERLASPTPSKPRYCLRWSPTGRIFDLKGKIIASSESECQSDNSNGDNACTFNPHEPMIKWFLNSTSFLGRNDHVATILGYGDLQWGNILITRVYFVEGLGHNLFSIGQVCDSDLEVAFRRNTCFVKNIEGVDLLKGNRSTNLYTINLHEMAFASPICLMARATSTKSWLWHQRLSYLNFDTINDLAKNDLVTSLP